MFDSLYESALELTKTLIQIPSMNPPGGEEEIARDIAARLERRGISATLVPRSPGRTSLVARIEGEEPGSIVLCAHLDTVRADEESWETPPLVPTTIEDRLYGRGAADMKAGVALAVALFESIADLEKKPKKGLILALTADEERGYGGAASLVKANQLDDSSLLIITEPTDGEVFTGQKGELWVEATFRGRAAHGSVPESGASAILPTMAFTLAIRDYVLGLPEIPGRGKNSINVGRINGGRQINIVPDECTVLLDCRVVDTGDRDRIVEEIDRLGARYVDDDGVGFERKLLMDKAPILSNRNNPLIKAFTDAQDQALAPRPPAIAPYSTDAVAITPVLKIPTIIYGPGSIIQAHQPNEYLELESLRNTTEVLSAFLERVLLA